MLVTRRRDHLSLVTQPEHAALAGRLGAEWGNERFTQPVERAALLLAATHHDDGWHELDSQPCHNERERRPAHFTELPLSRTVGPYGRGVESVYERDPLAGALVGMHFSGFYTGRWGLSAGDRLSDPIAAEVVAAQEARWMPALRQAWGLRGPRGDFDAGVWHAYEVLQALDLLSLALCLWEPGDDGEPVPVASTLAHVQQPPGARLVTDVPQRPGRRLHLELRPGADGAVSVSPWPFAADRLRAHVAVRRLEDRPYCSAAESAAAFAAARTDERVLVLTPAAGS